MKTSIFRLENDFSIYKIPTFNIVKINDSRLEIYVSIDIRDLNTLEDDLFKSIYRKIKSNICDIHKVQLREDIKKIIYNSNDNKKIIKQPEFEFTFELDFDRMAILALKTMYELIAWIKGEDFISSKQFDNIRFSLKNIILHNEIKYLISDFYNEFKMALKDNPFFEIKNFSQIDNIFARNRTIVFFMNGNCHTRVANLWFSFKMSKILNNELLVFTSESRTGIYNFYDLHDIVTNP